MPPSRDLLDTSRRAFVSDDTLGPVRTITYTRVADATVLSLNSFVGTGFFSKAERDALGNFEAFGGLALTVEPEVGDIVDFHGRSWKVKRWTRLGELYTVYGEIKRHNGRPSA